jgi:PKD repeat protein
MGGTQVRGGRWLITVVITMAALCVAAAPARALTVVEAWRVPYAAPGAVSVYPKDGSCYFTSGGAIVRLAKDGSLMQQINGAFTSVAASAKNGSFWAADQTTGELTRFAPDGAELWQGGDYLFPQWDWTHYLEVSPGDGSVWFGRTDSIGGWGHVVHVAADGTGLWESTDQFPTVSAISFNTRDGSCWAVSTFWFALHAVLHYAQDGTLLLSEWAYRPLTVSVNQADDSVWYAHGLSPAGLGFVFHMAADGTALWQAEFDDPHAVAVNWRDGSCWVGAGEEVIYLASDGTELWRSSGYGSSNWQGGGSLIVNPKDGSCRVGDAGHGFVARLNVVTLPQVFFTLSRRVGPAPLLVDFENWTLGTPDSCLWDFGDGATSTEEDPSHVYSAAGEYTVTLTAENECGCDTETQCLTVFPSQCATRTPGYWFTHPEALLEAFAAIAGDGDGGVSLCPSGGCTLTPEEAMAIFWRGQGLRTTFAQHALAAMFNNALLKPAPEGMIEAAMEVLCDPTSTNAEMSAAKARLVSYNQSGVTLPMTGYDFGNADPETAKEMASQADVPTCITGSGSGQRQATIPRSPTTAASGGQEMSNSNQGR